MDYYKRIYRGLSRKSHTCCMKENVPDFVQNPYNNSLWNSLPCPPPWNKEIIFKTNWVRHLDHEEGPRIIIEIARRCNFSVPERHQLPGRVSSGLILTSCEVECRSIVVITCLILLIAGITLLAYLFLVSERQRKVDKLKQQTEQKKYARKIDSEHYGSRKQVPKGTKETLSDRSRRDYSRDVDSISHSSDEQIRFKRQCKLNSYGNLPLPLFQEKTGSAKGEGESHISDNIYETLSGKNTMKVKFKDGVCNTSLESPVSGESDSCYESNGLVGHFYETLNFNDVIIKDLFADPPEMLDSPLAGNVVRKWEYQSTLNRKAALNRMRTVNLQSKNVCVK